MRCKRIAAALLCMAVFAGCATRNPGMQSKVDELMRPYSGDVPSASVLVLNDGMPLVKRAYGLADVEGHVAATPATNYRLASVTKQFTAACVLLLSEEGKLALNDPVRRWLPELPDTTSAVTIRHLLTHTGGLVDYEDVMPADQASQLHDADVLKILAGQRNVYFAPGTSYRYSNSGYALLALIVEHASGKSFQDFLRERIFLPLGMHDTLAYVDGGPEVPHRAYGYSEIEGRWVRTDQSTTSAVLGDGGVYSSIVDLAKWDAALYDDRLLSDASRAAAFSAHTQVVGEPYQAEYGYGWRITGDSLWHSGETIGFRNVIVRYPRHRLTVVLLSNRNDPEPYATAKAIAQLYLPKE